MTRSASWSKTVLRGASRDGAGGRALACACGASARRARRSGVASPGGRRLLNAPLWSAPRAAIRVREAAGSIAVRYDHVAVVPPSPRKTPRRPLRNFYPEGLRSSQCRREDGGRARRCLVGQGARAEAMLGLPDARSPRDRKRMGGFLGAVAGRAARELSSASTCGAITAEVSHCSATPPTHPPIAVRAHLGFATPRHASVGGARPAWNWATSSSVAMNAEQPRNFWWRWRPTP